MALTPEGKRLEWKSLFGRGFDLITKAKELRPLLERMNALGKLGKVIVDAGSGSVNAITAFGSTQTNVFYPFRRKKIIRIDIGSPRAFAIPARNVLEMRADIEDVEPHGLGQKKRLIAAAKFLKVDPRSTVKLVDSILLSDVLNYVDYRKAITGLSRFLKKGGRIIIHNQPGRGYDYLFSENAVKTNSELVRFLKESGFEIEHLTKSSPRVGKYERTEDVGDTDWIRLVAMKRE